MSDDCGRIRPTGFGKRSFNVLPITIMLYCKHDFTDFYLNGISCVKTLLINCLSRVFGVNFTSDSNADQSVAGQYTETIFQIQSHFISLLPWIKCDKTHNETTRKKINIIFICII